MRKHDFQRFPFLHTHTMTAQRFRDNQIGPIQIFRKYFYAFPKKKTLVQKY